MVYKVGVENKAADALSRQLEDADLKTLASYPIRQQSKEVHEGLQQDSVLQNLMQKIRTNPTFHPGYTVTGDLLFYNGRLVLSGKSPLILMLLKEFHASPTGGHSGFCAHTGMKGMVQDFVKSCDVCHRNKYVGTSP